MLKSLVRQLFHTTHEIPDPHRFCSGILTRKGLSLMLVREKVCRRKRPFPKKIQRWGAKHDFSQQALLPPPTEKRNFQITDFPPKALGAQGKKTSSALSGFFKKYGKPNRKLKLVCWIGFG